LKSSYEGICVEFERKKLVGLITFGLPTNTNKYYDKPAKYNF